MPIKNDDVKIAEALAEIRALKQKRPELFAGRTVTVMSQERAVEITRACISQTINDASETLSEDNFMKLAGMLRESMRYNFPDLTNLAAEKINEYEASDIDTWELARRAVQRGKETLQ